MPGISLFPLQQTASSLSDVLDTIDRVGASGGRVQVVADYFNRIGFDRVVVTLRDESLNPVVIGASGEAGVLSLSGQALKPLPGSVWRRRLAQIERFRIGDLYLLDGSDDWVAREFFGSDAEPSASDGRWLATDLIVGVLRGPDKQVLGFVKLASARSGRRPDEAKFHEIETVVRHLASRVAYDALEALARQRLERLQLLQEAGASLTRSLDEEEIARELVRQVQRAVHCDGVAILVPNLAQDTLQTVLRVSRGMEHTRASVRLGDGLVAEVARTGRSTRVGDREADNARERAGLPAPLSLYDITGDLGTAASAVVVPLRVGTRLHAVLAVYSSDSDLYAAEDEEVLATMASQAATAMANAGRYAESERERRTTEALADVARAVSESLRLGEVLRLILRHSIALLGVEGACVALRKGEYLHIVAASGGADVLNGVHVPVSGTMLGRCALENEVVLLNEQGDEPALGRSAHQIMRVQRAVMAPLSAGDGTIGSLIIINRERAFEADDAKILQRLADQVAVAIRNARLFEQVEKAMREWRVAFDSVASGIVVLEESLTVSRCNSRAAELCGTNIQGLLGRKFSSALLGEENTVDDSGIAVCVERAIADGLPVRELLHDRARSRLLTLLVNAHPDGGCVITFDDITETVRLAEQHRNVLELVSDAILVARLDGSLAFANPAAVNLFQREDLTDLHISDLIPPEWMAIVSANLKSVRQGTRIKYECEVLRADGSRRIVEVKATATTEAGIVNATVACLRDITEQRADALARERSEALFRGLADNTSVAVFTVDRDGRFTSINQGLQAVSGLKREQLIGLHFTALLEASYREQGMAALHSTLNGERVRFHACTIGRSGPMMTQVTTSPIKASGQITGVLGLVREVASDEI